MLRRFLRAALAPRGATASPVERALALRAEGRLAEATVLLRDALAQSPGDVTIATNLGVVLLEQNDAGDGVEALERALSIDPAYAPAHYNYANVLRASGRLGHAIAHYRAAKEADPQHPSAPEELMHASLEACDWDTADRVAADLREKAATLPESEWMRFVSPLTAIYVGLNPEQCKRVATFHAPSASPAAAPAARATEGERIHIGYFSHDFRDHAVGHVLRGVLALHDRTRFKVSAYSFGPDDGSVYRRAIEKSVDRFVDISRMSDADAAHAIADAKVDVLIDLMGHTSGKRLGVLARRAAPVQVHYLGYPGTIGAPFVDYFVSDATVTPEALQTHFTERVECVADCFMVSDGSDAGNGPLATRAEQKLPADAFVLANFGSASRITRRDFARWLRILEATPDSVMWLRNANALAAENLRLQAQRAGIDASRLIFAERASNKATHLARAALADLALDTVGWYNGHSTAADMLWAGVPVLTCPGNTFANRVAASLVRAAGTPALVTRDADEYVSVAQRLARDGNALRALRETLRLRSGVFFDTPRLVRGLEASYAAVYAAKMSAP